jgi:hypothetical protein
MGLAAFIRCKGPIKKSGFDRIVRVPSRREEWIIVTILDGVLPLAGDFVLRHIEFLPKLFLRVPNEYASVATPVLDNDRVHVDLGDLRSLAVLILRGRFEITIQEFNHPISITP